MQAGKKFSDLDPICRPTACSSPCAGHLGAQREANPLPTRWLPGFETPNPFSRRWRGLGAEALFLLSGNHFYCSSLLCTPYICSAKSRRRRNPQTVAREIAFLAPPSSLGFPTLSRFNFRTLSQLSRNMATTIPSNNVPKFTLLDGRQIPVLGWVSFFPAFLRELGSADLLNTIQGNGTGDARKTATESGEVSRRCSRSRQARD